MQVYSVVFIIIVSIRDRREEITPRYLCPMWWFLLALILLQCSNVFLIFLGKPLWEFSCWKMEESNTKWWMPVLAKPFTTIDAASILPEGWTPNVLGPLCKKGNKIDPENYRSASLLDLASKLCTCSFLNEEWEESSYFCWTGRFP